jgi:transcriptional regulator with PAS, ATPase and Fis domain
MIEHNWVKEFDAAITVCDETGIILEMNDKSAKTFEKDGGKALIGKNLFDCHNEKSQEKLREIIDEQKPNTYTIEKDGKKKLIHQSPWYKDGRFSGVVELSIEIPVDMPHFNRN